MPVIWRHKTQTSIDLAQRGSSGLLYTNLQSANRLFYVQLVMKTVQNSAKVIYIIQFNH